MKKIVFLLMLALSVGTLCMAQNVRVDVRGAKGVKVTPRNEEGFLKTSNPKFVADEETRSCFVTTEGSLSKDQWQDYKFFFEAGGEGYITVQFKCGYADKDNSWAKVSDVKLNGELLPNGNLKKTYTNKDGKIVPNGFSITGSPIWEKDGGENGSGASIVNHDNYIRFNIPKAEVGNVYIFEFRAIVAEKPSLGE